MQSVDDVARLRSEVEAGRGTTFPDEPRRNFFGMRWQPDHSWTGPLVGPLSWTGHLPLSLKSTWSRAVRISWQHGRRVKPVKLPPFGLHYTSKEARPGRRRRTRIKKGRVREDAWASPRLSQDGLSGEGPKLGPRLSQDGLSGEGPMVDPAS